MNCLVTDLFLALWDGIRCLIELLFSNVQHESAGIQVHTVLRLGYLKRSTGRTESDGVMQKTNLDNSLLLRGNRLFNNLYGMQLSVYQTKGQVSATHTDNASLSLNNCQKTASTVYIHRTVKLNQSTASRNTTVTSTTRIVPKSSLTNTECMIHYSTLFLLLVLIQ